MFLKLGEVIFCDYCVLSICYPTFRLLLFENAVTVVGTVNIITKNKAIIFLINSMPPPPK